jgi:hypothetical protein
MRYHDDMIIDELPHQNDVSLLNSFATAMLSASADLDSDEPSFSRVIDTASGSVRVAVKSLRSGVGGRAVTRSNIVISEKETGSDSYEVAQTITTPRVATALLHSFYREFYQCQLNRVDEHIEELRETVEGSL